MIYVIVGPTASGKSSLALELAKKYKGVIVNGDAFQVYKGMDIGTAKPTQSDLETVPHYLFDIFEPSHEFSIFEYQELLRKTLNDLKDKMVFVVGGSGLYLKSAFYDFTLEKNSSCDMSRFDSYSDEELFNHLKEVDINATKNIHQNNRKRVLRALEIYYSTGKKKSEIEEKQVHKPIMDVTFIGRNIPRNILYERINKRVDEMVEEGLFLEVDNLLKKYNGNEKSLQAIGYKEIINGKRLNESDALIIDKIKQATRRYAKRQMTYFLHQLDVNWINDISDAIKIIEGE